MNPIYRKVRVEISFFCIRSIRLTTVINSSKVFIERPSSLSAGQKPTLTIKVTILSSSWVLSVLLELSSLCLNVAVAEYLIDT